MNRRDFLKTLGLALSALALPKLAARTAPPTADAVQFDGLREKCEGASVALREMAEAAGEAAKELKTHSLTDYTEVCDELLSDSITGREEMFGTLFGHPVVVVDHFDPVLLCPRCNVALEDFGPSHVVEGRNYWHCLTCRHSYRDECGALVDLGREGALAWPVHGDPVDRGNRGRRTAGWADRE